MECPICLDNVESFVKFKCGHGTCKTCFVTYLEYVNRRRSFECPICRAIVQDVYMPEDPEQRSVKICCSVFVITILLILLTMCLISWQMYG